VLVSSTEGKKQSTTHRLSGRAEDSRLVHFEVPAGSAIPRPGDVVTVTITEASTFHLVADSDGTPLKVRRTRSGDAWDRAEAESCAVPAASSTGGAKTVSLGLPSLRVGPPTAVTIPIYDITDGQR